jgi:hypothetical protein
VDSGGATRTWEYPGRRRSQEDLGAPRRTQEALRGARIPREDPAGPSPLLLLAPPGFSWALLDLLAPADSSQLLLRAKVSQGLAPSLGPST